MQMVMVVIPAQNNFVNLDHVCKHFHTCRCLIMRWGEHLWGQPALDVEGEGGADVRVVARIVHQHNLIQLSSASGMSSMHIFYISLLVVELIACGKAVSIKENTDKILLEQVKVKHIQLRNTKFLDGLQKAPCTFGRPRILKLSHSCFAVSPQHFFPFENMFFQTVFFWFTALFCQQRRGGLHLELTGSFIQSCTAALSVTNNVLYSIQHILYTNVLHYTQYTLLLVLLRRDCLSNRVLMQWSPWYYGIMALWHDNLVYSIPDQDIVLQRHCE